MESDKSTYRNGIPKAVFIQNEQEYFKNYTNKEIQQFLTTLNNLLQKYSILESSLSVKKMKMESRLPSVEQSLDYIKLKQNKDDTTNKSKFLLHKNVYGSVETADVDKFYIWRGINVMIEYNMEEAIQVLNQMSDSIQSTIKSTADDLEFIKEQLTVTQVNISRSHNYLVDINRQK